ncbi:TPA: M20/M25/M40 family metallo-hydrolase [Candidatus Poribacteria bacterium]|nr:M20/M25/M40 family metallo-hydrolase [Candidatus Poribacteria bacterium]HIB90043.1 M20/M25/M40 family metallo-hydrolase [Candidatus Poribacteria bacterium]HIB98090.1 M20/M25/M40 family metallo-hydrolase [Candidatus Poribacteria bacterium]HIN27921.1 M20/M25/M40 family metallo-hydrolase [Candidatus Poribacteria bacterium]HIO08583.1 M20/M25/M40 family metallo-hydrolase [Candidatus Poribacteria bacterium]
MGKLSIVTNNLLQQAAHILSNLIQIPTVAGTDQESQAATYLLDTANKAGLNGRVVEPQPGKGSFIAHLPGESEECLLLLSHLDVATVNQPDNWRYPPFSGKITDQAVWGRGAIDCKGLVVVWLVILYLLHNLKRPLQRSVTMIAAADEESGGNWGTKWLMQNIPECQKIRWALNEGGGYPLVFRHRNFITCQTGEKGRILLRANDPPLDSPLPSNSKFKAPPTPSTRRMLEKILPKPISKRFLSSGIARLYLRYLQKGAPYSLDPDQLFQHEVNFELHDQSVDLKIRTMPGTDSEELIMAIIDDYDLDQLQWTEISRTDATESPLDNQLYNHIQVSLNKFLPNHQIIPHITPGYSDSRFLRRIGIPAYGFFPLFPDAPLTSQHSDNEFLSFATLRQAIEILFDVVTQFCL